MNNLNTNNSSLKGGKDTLFSYLLKSGSSIPEGLFHKKKKIPIVFLIDFLIWANLNNIILDGNLKNKLLIDLLDSIFDFPGTKSFQKLLSSLFLEIFELKRKEIIISGKDKNSYDNYSLSRLFF